MLQKNDAMDYKKLINSLLQENIELQDKIENYHTQLQKKDEEIQLLADDYECKASLQSRMDNNKLEIAQLKINYNKEIEKNNSLQLMQEQMELELLKANKKDQKNKHLAASLIASNTELQITTQNLDDATALYKTVQKLKFQLAEANSLSETVQIENRQLKDEIKELNDLLAYVRNKKN